MKRHLREAIAFARELGAASVELGFTGGGHARLTVAAPDGRRRTVTIAASPSARAARWQVRRDIQAALMVGGGGRAP